MAAGWLAGVLRGVGAAGGWTQVVGIDKMGIHGYIRDMEFMST